MTGPSPLPAGAEVLQRARAAVLAAIMAPTADAGWSAALDAVLAGLDVTGLARRSGEALPALLELAEVAATLATMLGRREVLILTTDEVAGADEWGTALAELAEHDQQGLDPDPGGTP